MTNPLVPNWLSAAKDLNKLDGGIWPSSAARNDRGELEIGGVNAPELVRQYGSPLYVVDQADFESRLDAVRNAFVSASSKAATSVVSSAFEA